MDKNELLAAMSDSYAKLSEQIGKMTDDELNATFQFANDPKKCGARWIYDQCARDLLIHLYEWQVLMREFVNNIRMDKMLVEKHQNTSFQEAQRLLEQTHHEMIQLADSFSEKELFTKGHYKCTYTTDMAAYFASVTTSPYKQALKMLKTHQKMLKTSC